MKIRAFDVYRQRRKYCIYLRGIKCMALDAALVHKDRRILDRMVDKLHNELHPILKRMDNQPEYFGQLIAEFNGVPV